MHRCLGLLLLSSYLLTSAADPYTCNGVQTINPPANISNAWFYPATWNDTLEPPQYAALQNCTWNFNVPKGYFAYFTLKANTNNGAVLRMTDSVGYVTTYTSVSMEPFYVMDPSFKVELQSTTVGNLGLRVIWRQVPPFFPTTVLVKANGSPNAILSGQIGNGTVIEADKQVSLLSFPPSTGLTDVTPYMRLTQVYDGPNITSKLLGNLWQVMTSGNQLISSGKHLSLHTLYQGAAVGNVIAQDYFNVRDIKTLKAVWCVLPNICQVSLDARQGRSAAIRYSQAPFYVKSLSLPQTNKLSVFTDFVTDAHKLAEYTSDSAKTNIPQKFSSLFTTFVLDQDQAVIQLSSTPSDSKWAQAFEGRRGFVVSSNYAVRGVGTQDFTDQVLGNKKYNISYTVQNSGIFDDAKLHVTIFDGSNTVVDNVYSKTNFPAGPVYATGDNILVDYKGNGANTTGAFVTFGFDKYNSAGTLSFLTAIITALWMALC